MFTPNDFFSDKVQTCHKNFNPNATYLHTWAEKLFIERKNSKLDVQYINYKLNNFGHRCDDFKKIHNKKHILFAGCSFTFGEGVGYKENWSGRLYSLLENIYECDGYYSLGFQNGVVSQIVHNIIRYCENFGDPEIIICMLPDAVRKITVNDSNEFIIDYKFNDIESAEGRSRAYHNIFFLEKYCSLKNIKLVWSTWHKGDAEFYKKIPLNNFLLIKDEDILLNAKNKNEKNHPLYKIARDHSHPGLRYHDGLANIFYDYLTKDNNEQN